MIASLYQSGSSASWALLIRRLGLASRHKVVVEVAARCGRGGATRKMWAGHDVGVELDVVARPVPQVARVAQQVVHLERPVGVEPRARQVRSTQPDCAWCGSRLTTTRTTSSPVLGALAVADQLLVVDGVEAQRCRLLCRAGFSRRMRLTRRDERRAGCRAAPRSQCLISYFSESRYSSRPGTRRRAPQLEGRAVDAVAARQGRREHQTRR